MTRDDATLGEILEKAGIPKEKQNEVLTSKTGRNVRKDVKIVTLIKRGSKTDKKK
ncbi:MAG: hypothetical protein QM233_01605 [Candidatus Cloacimonadota bacterium]|nr:hypothetical protein [Candidatus Cloacimonadota bacterium]